MKIKCMDCEKMVEGEFNGSDINGNPCVICEECLEQYLKPGRENWREVDGK